MIKVGKSRINEGYTSESVNESSSKWFVIRDKGGSSGESTKRKVKFYDTEKEAKSEASRKNKNLTPGEKTYYGIHYAAVEATESNIKKWDIYESISESTSTSKSINNIVIDYYNNGSGNFDLLVNSKNFSTNAQLNKLLDGFQEKKLIDGYLSSPSKRSVVDIYSKLSKKKLISSLAELYTKVSDTQGKVLN
jgi:hypothetical protein